MGSTKAKQQHIVMLPYLAQGHLIPFLELATKIHQRFGFKITIATTPLNIQYLSLTIAKNNANSQIHLSELPFNTSDHDLPPNTENTESVPFTKIINLFQASKSLESPFRKLISDITTQDGNPPLCIISDIFMGWAYEVAKSCNTLNVSFNTGGAYGGAAYISIWQNLPHRSMNTELDGEKQEEFNVPGFPNSCKFHITQLHQYIRDADGSDAWSRFFQPQIELSLKSFGFLSNTVKEIEPLGFEILQTYTKLPVWCIGPLLPQRMLTQKPIGLIGQRTGREPGVSAEHCIEWLGCKADNTVLYISFGSQNSISSSQMMALALGLEDSKTPFVWVIRPPVGFDSKGEFKPEWLPEGFEERMRKTKQGLIIHGWASQLEILCHKSTGAFLSHCGWNSTMESLSQGVPMIGWPLAAEQAYNSKMLVEEMGVAVELTRSSKSNVSREDVRKVIDIVMREECKRNEMRERAAKIGELIRASVIENGSEKGSSHTEIDDFIATVVAKSQEHV